MWMSVCYINEIDIERREYIASQYYCYYYIAMVAVWRPSSQYLEIVSLCFRRRFESMGSVRRSFMHMRNADVVTNATAELRVFHLRILRSMWQHHSNWWFRPPLAIRQCHNVRHWKFFATSTDRSCTSDAKFVQNQQNFRIFGSLVSEIGVPFSHTNSSTLWFALMFWTAFF